MLLLTNCEIMALSANELRIGNYVNCPKDGQNPFRIDLFDYVSNGIGKFRMIYDKNTHPLTWYLQDLKPISLTEDWLLKFGFIQNTSNSYYWLNYGTNGILIVKYNDYYKKYTLELGKGMNIVLDFVHHFQNICFDLTRHELIIKQ